MSYESLFKSYNWPRLLVELQGKERNQDEEIWYEALLTAWWRQPRHDRITNKWLLKKKHPLTAFVAVLRGLYCSDYDLYLKSFKQLKKTRPPAWLIQWAKLEEHGRAFRYEAQAELLSQIGSDEDWPYAATLQSIQDLHHKPDALYTRMSAKCPANPIARVLYSKLAFLKEDYGTAAGIMNDVLNQGGLDARYSGVANLYLGYALYKNDDYSKSLIAWDAACKAGFVDYGSLRNWITLSLSYADSWQSTIDRINFALNIVPRDIYLWKEIISYALICCWLQKKYKQINSLVVSNQDMVEMDIDSAAYKISRIFFKYITRLGIFREENPHLYQDDGQATPLHIIGESHAMSPANLHFSALGKKFVGRTHAVIGVKMWHVATSGQNVFKHCFLSHLEKIDANSHLLFCIGEIDSRPDDGIWKQHTEKGRSLTEIVTSTVDGYFDSLAKSLRKIDPAQVIIQGVPAPSANYLKRVLESEDVRDEYVGMVRDVNERMKRGAKERGWLFFDVYSATAGTNGCSTMEWNLDNTHLKPAIYLKMDEWLS